MPKNIMGTTLSTTYHGSSNHKIFGTHGELCQYVENVAVSSSMGMTPSTITGYGISYITTTGVTPTSGVGIVYLAPPPNVGVEKTVILDSTAAGGTFDICISTGTGAGAGLLGSSDDSAPGARYIHFSTLAVGTQSVTLVGLTTALWWVKCCNIVDPDSSDAPLGWGNSGGIRASTAVNTT